MGGNPPGMWRVGSRGGSPGRCQALNRAVRPAAGSLPRQPPRRRPPPRYRDMSWGCDASVFRARLLGGPPEPGMAPRGAHRELPKAIGPLMAPFPPLFPHLLPHFPLYFPISPFFSPFPPPIPSHELLRPLRVPGGHPGAASPGGAASRRVPGGSACWGPPGSHPAPLGAGGGREVPRLAGGSPALCFPQEAGFCSGGQRGDLVQRLLALRSSAGPSLPAGRGVRQRLVGEQKRRNQSSVSFLGGFAPKGAWCWLRMGFPGRFPQENRRGEWRQELPRALLGVLGCLSSPWGKKQQLKIMFGVGSVKKGVKQR